MCTFTLEEIHEALQNTVTGKAPGPDGNNANVLKAQWPFIKEDVLQFFCQFFINSSLPLGCNASFIS